MSKIFSVHKNKIILNKPNISANSNTVMAFIQNTLGVNIIEDSTVDRIYLDKNGNLRVYGIETTHPTGNLLYKFGLLSDTHVDGDGTDEAYSISDLNNAISFL